MADRLDDPRIIEALDYDDDWEAALAKACSYVQHRPVGPHLRVAVLRGQPYGASVLPNAWWIVVRRR